MQPLNIFYENPDPDRWIKFDRYPRRWVRRIVRGKPRPGGQQMVAINLLKGLDKLRIPYRYNDYKFVKKNPDELACIIGKPQVLFDRKWQNPVIFGPSIYSHPLDYPDLLVFHPNVKQVLVPGNWMCAMFKPYYSDKVVAWPVGTDTSFWKPGNNPKDVDILIYDKPLWGVEKAPDYIINGIIKYLTQKGLNFKYVKYGSYKVEQLLNWAQRSKACIVLSQHETQGLAYQQILSTGTPIFAYDKGGYWPDKNYYPHKVKFEPVTSVPYWDDRCGMKFKDEAEFEILFDDFYNKLAQFDPRSYILENLTLEKSAQKYLSIVREIEKGISVEATVK